jgi:NADH:ubiquinone oxidoreductase subunit H
MAAKVDATLPAGYHSALLELTNAILTALGAALSLGRPSGIYLSNPISDNEFARLGGTREASQYVRCALRAVRFSH